MPVRAIYTDFGLGTILHCTVLTLYNRDMRDYSLDSLDSIGIQFVTVGRKTPYLVKVTKAVKKIK